MMDTNYLAHYGVKGMKWRKRKNKALDIAWEVAHPISGRKMTYRDVLTGEKMTINQNRRNTEIRFPKESKKDLDRARRLHKKATKRRQRVIDSINKVKSGFKKTVSSSSKAINNGKKTTSKVFKNINSKGRKVYRKTMKKTGIPEYGHRRRKDGNYTTWKNW